MNVNRLKHKLSQAFYKPARKRTGATDASVLLTFTELEKELDNISAQLLGKSPKRKK